MVYAFDSFELSEAKFELRRRLKQIRVEPKVLRALFYLVRNRQRLVTRVELLEVIWPGVTTVSDASLDRVVYRVRQALAERKNGEQFVQTVRGMGYRFVREVVEERCRALPVKVTRVGSERSQSRESTDPPWNSHLTF